MGPSVLPELPVLPYLPVHQPELPVLPVQPALPDHLEHFKRRHHRKVGLIASIQCELPTDRDMDRFKLIWRRTV